MVSTLWEFANNILMGCYQIIKDQDYSEDNQPSQVEGDRATIEADLGEPSDINKATEGKVIPSEGETSQAEGERD